MLNGPLWTYGEELALFHGIKPSLESRLELVA
jgi:hypothetical protein